MTRLLLILALSLCCLTASASPGQPYFVRQQVSSGPFTPANLPSLTYWWVASDLTNTPVTNWVDRVSGKLAVSTNTEAPVWGTNKVTFNQAKHLYVRPKTIPLGAGSQTNWAVMVICTCKQLSSNGSFLSDTNSSAILQLNSGTPNQIRWCGGTYRNVANGTTFDFTYAKFAGTNKIYTNSILFETSSVDLSTQIDIGRIGSFVGGDIYEVAIWTNAVGWTTTDVANLHNYATNLYKYTP